MLNKSVLDDIKYRMRLITKTAWLEEKAKQHPEDVPVSKNVFTMFLGGYYAEHTPKGQQIMRYLREDGYLVDQVMDKAA